ncbi:Tim44-like domain-containing protein [Chitiniphilus purpureus]|uniref:Tim44-like domain-containing protein n=1 Tax=Chitiniphilus purpureus TaxID=2981137 RepID=A0ABY6DJ58_9NEIS|nr:Tim44-like domain-containing protein [Chitiniphilus sp. CD1]UXY14399.1 Tim44-like domain-containing protein [Chitiniphilus sp. CD1]
MKRLLIAVFAMLVGLGAIAEDAEARRFGGGKSSGMQRTAPQRNVDQAPVRPQQPVGATPRKNSWLGPIAGLAAGLGLAALFSHLGLGEGFANFVMLALLVLAVVLVVRWLMRRAQPRSAPPLQYAAGPAQLAPMPGAAKDPVMPTAGLAGGAGGASAFATPSLPPGFDGEGFAREAKRNFIRLQAAYDAGDLEDIRTFTSPEMFAEVKLQLAERGTVPQTTDVVELHAQVIECVDEGPRYVTSVRFSGLIREERNAAPTPFDETWHLTKPHDGRHGWVVAGIQQNI